MKEYLEKVIAGDHLSQDEMSDAFDMIMSGKVTPVQLAGFLVALRMKGETTEEIAGGAISMRAHAVQIDTGDLKTVDTCGTGGDSSNSFNVSTTAAFVAAGAGVPVAKHGNKSISSKCGSADVLMALGVNLDVTPEVVARCIREAGIGFMYAPKMHPAMKYAMPARKELGIRTIFNMLGPLTNPAGAKCQVLGVFNPSLTELFANVLKLMGSERAFVVHGLDGMDEITVTAKTRVSELSDGKVTSYDLDPLDYISEYAASADLVGGEPEENAEITRSVLAGESGVRREIVCLNAAAAIVAGGQADSLKDGFVLAGEAIDNGASSAVLDRLVDISNSE